MIVDLLGWFTGPSAADVDDRPVRAARPAAPARHADHAPACWPGGTRRAASRRCRAPASLVTNVTATLADRAGFVTAFPAGTPLPSTSTLNPAMHRPHARQPGDHRSSAPAGWRTSLAAGADLVVDVTGIFTGTPVAATEPAPPNRPGTSRVLMVGDSTLAAVPLYPDSKRAFIGFDAVVDADVVPAAACVRRA